MSTALQIISYTVPREKKGPIISIRVTESDKEALDAMAAYEDRPVSTFVYIHGIRVLVAKWQCQRNQNQHCLQAE